MAWLLLLGIPLYFCWFIAVGDERKGNVADRRSGVVELQLHVLR